MEFIAYHSLATMGCRKNSNFFMNTNKSVRKLEGKYVWVVEGLGKKQYVLRMRYLANEIGEGEEGFKYSVRGSTEDGKEFNPQIPLHDLEWFNDFKRSVANFSIGLTELKEPYLSHFREVARMNTG